MKKLTTMLILIWLLLFSSQIAMANEDKAPLELVIDGQIIMADPAPYIDAASGRTMLPLRLISEYLGFTVNWDAALRQATISDGSKTMDFIIDSNTAFIDDIAYPLDVAATIYQDSSMIPLRFLSEHLGAQISWQAELRRVEVLSPNGFKGSLPVINQEDLIANDLHISGYYFDTASWQMLQDYSADFDTIIHFAYRVFTDGSVAAKNYNAAYDQAKAFAAQQGIEQILLITNFGDPVNTGKDTDTIALLNNPTNRAQAVANIAALVKAENAAGVDIDFELMPAATKDSLTAFIQELKAALPDKLITISLPPKREQDTWQQAFDYQALGIAADRVHIMFYDQHYGGSEPGAVAEPKWIEDGLKYLTTQIEPSKLHLMLGAYGRSWGLGSAGQSIRNQEALDLAAQNGVAVQRDSESLVPYIKYTANGQNVEIWFEDEISLAAKAALAKQYDLGGIGLWRMGMPSDAVWQAIMQVNDAQI